jgi:hypothetical protein
VEALEAFLIVGRLSEIELFRLDWADIVQICCFGCKRTKRPTLSFELLRMADADSLSCPISRGRHSKGR